MKVYDLKTLDEHLEGTTATSETWRRLLGKEFEPFKRAFLHRTGDYANYYPSQHKCGCSLTVTARENKTIVGVSECGLDGCCDVELKPADVELWNLDVGKLARAIAWVFDCTPMALESHARFAMKIAVYGPSATLVFLTFAESHDRFRQVITRLVQDAKKPFILLGLTSKFVDEQAKKLLERCGSQFVDLTSQTTFNEEGQLKALMPPEELFFRFLPPKAEPADGLKPTTSKHLFRQVGDFCEIVFAGRPVFHLSNTDGAKYLDFLLHHPNRPIGAFELEQMVKPEKGSIREENSIQSVADSQARREARQELVTLIAEQEAAEAEGNTAKAKRLESEIAKVKSWAGNESVLHGDTGERARDNIRKAIKKVVVKLRKSGKAEQAFSDHIHRFVSLGYDIMYNQPESMSWE